MGLAKVSNILRIAQDYLLPLEERMMFDWLVVKQEDFGLEKPFRHSIPQVQKATGVTRHSQEKAIKHFTDLGFLVTGTDYYQNNPFRTYFVDFAVLGRPEVLEKVIKKETETYREFSEWIGELAKAQAKKERPLSRNKKKQQEMEATKAKEEAENLYKVLCKVWNDRIDLYNKGELTGELPERKRIHNQLPIGRNGLRLLWKLRSLYDSSSIQNAFIVFADRCMKEELTPKNIFLYFLKCEDGFFPVVDEMINHHALHYVRWSPR